MNQQRFIGGMVIFLGSLIILPFLSIKKCHFDEKTSEVALIRDHLSQKNTYQILPAVILNLQLDNEEDVVSQKIKQNSFQNYALQVGAFKEIARLNSTVKVLKQMRLNPLIQQVQTAKGVLYKLIVQQGTKEQLAKLAEQLKVKLKVDPIIVQFIS